VEGQAFSDNSKIPCSRSQYVAKELSESSLKITIRKLYDANYTWPREQLS
jgi:hypothetical protein